ncbi:MAG: hypothetical protein WDW36_009824 [Sanguina aurantia]
MENSMEALLLRGQLSSVNGVTQGLLNAHEAERLIDQLQPISIEEVGSSRWHTQHDAIEKLNLQAHCNAQSHSDEFVVEGLVSFDKMSVLVKELLVIEAWKEFLFPHLAMHLATNVDRMLTYLLLYHETAVANLLEVTLFHSHALQAVGEDCLLELADWAYRKLTYLNTDGAKHAQPLERSAQQMMAQTPAEELAGMKSETDFGIAMCSLTILRYITDALTTGPMGLLSRVVSTNDTLMGLLPLIDRPPWVRQRRGKGGGTEKWIGNGWSLIPPGDRFKLTPADVQVWLCLANLILEPSCRAKYGQLDSYRREALLGVRRHLNELMFDQLPLLVDLQRTLDEISLHVGGVGAEAAKGAALILEQVPMVRTALLKGRDWSAMARLAATTHFGPASKALGRERMEAMARAFDFMCEMEHPESLGTAAAGSGAGSGGAEAPAQEAGEEGSLQRFEARARAAPLRLQTSRKAQATGGFEPWADLQLQLDPSKPAEQVELSAGGSTVTGLRFRLLPLPVDDSRPFPSNGKVSVRHGSSLLAEALLSLPEVPVRSVNDGPAALWVTVGLLATEGMALQLKMKKADVPKERDRSEGVWYAYHPVGGAVTLLLPQADTLNSLD